MTGAPRPQSMHLIPRSPPRWPRTRYPRQMPIAFGDWLRRAAWMRSWR